MSWKISTRSLPIELAGVAPTMDYRFAIDRNLIDSVSLQNKITFTGGNQGTFVGSDGKVQYAATNVPRFDHDLVTRQCLGLLIEGERTNIVTGSHTIWPLFTGGGTVENQELRTFAPNAEIAPDGTKTAYLIDTQQIYSNIRTTVSVVSGQSYSGSMWVKKVPGITYEDIYIGGDAWLNPSNKTINYSNSLNTNSDWIRVSGTFVANITMGSDFWFVRGQSSNGVAGQPVYVWGPQLEVASSATSYIPTPTSQTVTRTADSAVINGTGVITGTYTMVEKPAGCAVVSGTNIVLQPGFRVERVMVFPASLTSGQIAAIRAAM